VDQVTVPETLKSELNRANRFLDDLMATSDDRSGVLAAIIFGRTTRTWCRSSGC
jgi:hypothetical protein